MRAAILATVVAIGILATATPAHAQVSRREVDTQLADGVAKSHACGAKFRGVYDWKAYDAIDFTGRDHGKKEQLEYEVTSVETVGDGLDQACEDRDCKAVLAKVDTIVYRPADRLRASIDGHTLTITTNPFGSTLYADDFRSAIQATCESAQLAPDDDTAKPSKRKPRAKELGKASSKWDGKYPVDTLLASVGTDLCHPTKVTPLTVSHGKFSFDWYIDDWNRKEHDLDSIVKAGHIDGVVHDDGSATATTVWDAPALASHEVRIVKIKRRLDAIADPTVTFSIAGKEKEVKAVVELEDFTCEAGWSIRTPRKHDPNNENPQWGRHMSEHDYDTMPEWKKGVVYGKGTRIKHYYSANPNALFYECRQATCSADALDDERVWKEYGWY